MIKAQASTILLAVLLSGCIVPVDRAFVTDPRLPQEVNDIWLDAQHGRNEFKVFRQRIYARYGKPAEDSEAPQQWTFDRGLLSIDPIAGAFFVTRAGEMIRIAPLRNPLSVALYGSYSMSSRPTADYGHESCWLGDVEIRVNGTYLYTDSGRFLAQRKDQANNFFMAHPSGRFEVTYLDGFGPATIVESIRGRRRVAKLVFLAADGAERTYFIKVVPGLQLAFDGDEMEFELNSGFLDV
jgi:hypothetical protein